MLYTFLTANGCSPYRFTICPVNDHPYNDPAWISEVRTIVNHYVAKSGYERKTILFGHTKEGNDYLTWFPEWKYTEVASEHKGSATDIRDKLFASDSDYLHADVKADWGFYLKEKELFKNYPFPETLNFNCSDAVVTCLGRVLLITRKFAPGRGALALPGGFKNRTENFLDCAVRELYEETNLKVPEKVLRGSLKSKELFDSPKRSMGIPRNTYAFHFDVLPDANGELPKVNGGDDANECGWYDLFDVINSLHLYDDHAAIVSKMLGVVPSAKLN
jgi:bifunctional NMN adenylyltransferase/nudix hydrolase